MGLCGETARLTYSAKNAFDPSKKSGLLRRKEAPSTEYRVLPYLDLLPLTQPDPRNVCTVR